MMSPSYVECDDFRVVHDDTFGVAGEMLRHRIYTLRQNPDQRQGDTIVETVVKAWTLAGSPPDGVFHLGRFHRVTLV